MKRTKESTKTRRKSNLLDWFCSLGVLGESRRKLWSGTLCDWKWYLNSWKQKRPTCQNCGSSTGACVTGCPTSWKAKQTWNGCWATCSKSSSWAPSNSWNIWRTKRRISDSNHACSIEACSTSFRSSKSTAITCRATMPRWNTSMNCSRTRRKSRSSWTPSNRKSAKLSRVCSSRRYRDSHGIACSSQN